MADRGPSGKDGNFLSPRIGWRGILGRTFFFLGGNFTKSSSLSLKWKNINMISNHLFYAPKPEESTEIQTRLFLGVAP